MRIAILGDGTSINVRQWQQGLAEAGAAVAASGSSGVDSLTWR